jgi:hypothetical protein
MIVICVDVLLSMNCRVIRICILIVFFFKGLKFFYFFCYKLIFLMFLNHFNVLMSKIIFFKIKKYYFDAFPSEKHPKN